MDKFPNIGTHLKDCDVTQTHAGKSSNLHTNFDHYPGKETEIHE